MDGFLKLAPDLLHLAIIFLALACVRILLTVFHEAGHAIAMAILTKGKILVFLGTYSNVEKSAKLAIGRFEIWIIRNIIKWKGGCCIATDRNVTIRKQIIYILAGPIATLLVAIFFTASFFYFHPGRLMAPVLLVSSIMAGLSFLYNIVPAYAAIIDSNGGLTYNDGAQLEKLFKLKKQPPEQNEAIALINDQRYEEGAPILEKVIDNGTKDADVYRMAIFANIKLKKYGRANDLQKEQIARIGNLNTHDRITLALLKTYLGKYDEAIRYYKHLLQTGEDNKFNLNNFGYTLTLIERFEEAIFYLDKSILIDNTFPEAYNNRGYARMKLGFIEDGKADVIYSLQLDDTNSYAYRNLGIYHFDRGNYRDALVEFERAKELDPDTLLLNGYLIETGNKLDDI